MAEDEELSHHRTRNGNQSLIRLLEEFSRTFKVYETVLKDPVKDTVC